MLTQRVEEDEIKDKGFWLRNFRKAKSQKTLQLMVSKAIDKYHSNSGVVAAIYLAECQRERELESGVLLNR
ncbi:hypothetical protein [Dongshaea marina]|uniref:hypothetical protein n=1 Tax=Dongshaea marina TaxID=2047966 RepID=UPI000D3E2661|nr:hypothetical protein [Dongshaea marina]